MKCVKKGIHSLLMAIGADFDSELKNVLIV